MNNLEKIVVSLKDSRPLVKIGWTGENDARGIVWDISTWQTIYGDGTCTLLNQRETDDAPYPCSITIDGKFAIWQVTDGDLGSGGYGECQLIYTVSDETVAKSPVYKTLAERSLGNGTEPPESASDWVLQVLQAGQDAVDAAERAEDAAKKAEDTADGATEAVNSAATAGIQVVNAAGQAAIGAVGNAQTSAVAAVNDAKNAGVQAVNDAKENAVEAVQGAQTTALNAITEAQTQATEAVNTAGENAVNSVNSAGQTAVENAQTAITTAKNQAVSDVQNAGQSATENVQNAQTAGVQAVKTAQTTAVQAVQNAGTAEVEKINDILPVPTEADAGKVPVAKPDGSGYELGETGVQIDDTKTALDTTWSSENIVSRICPPFTTEGAIVTCNPVEGSQLNTVVQIEPVQEGTGDPSPENIRPIQGWDSVIIWRGGKNLLGEDLPALDGFIDNASNAIVSSTSQGKTYVVPIKKYGTFTVSVNKTQVIRLATCAFKPYVGASLSTITTATSTYRSITTNSSDRYLVVNLPSVDFEADEPMLVYGDESSYEPYCGKMIEIPFGQTVYGGTLDVGSGVLTIIDKLSDLPEIPESENNGILEFTNVVRFNLRLKLIFTDANSDIYPGISSHFPYNVNYSQDTPHWYIGSGSLLLFINKSELGSYDISGLNAWVSKYSPVQFVYRLANPVTVQLTPQEILALSGENTVYADAGNITVSGYSDPNAIIKNLSDRIAALEHNAIGG